MYYMHYTKLPVSCMSGQGEAGHTAELWREELSPVLGILGPFAFQSRSGSRRSAGVRHHLNPAVWVHISVLNGLLLSQKNRGFWCPDWQMSLWEWRPKNSPGPPHGPPGCSGEPWNLGGLSLTGFKIILPEQEWRKPAGSKTLPHRSLGGLGQEREGRMRYLAEAGEVHMGKDALFVPATARSSKHSSRYGHGGGWRSRCGRHPSPGFVCHAD